jgi:hypothetical protein
VISASCHCGAVRIEIPFKPESATCCNCSVCRRLGALWAFFPVDAVRIRADRGATQNYVWGKRTRRFVRCTACGCTTHVYPAAGSPQREIEVNVRMFEPTQLGWFRIRLFDGADTWKYVGELPMPPSARQSSSPTKGA